VSVDITDGEPCSVYKTKLRRARKAHTCAACKEPIRRGDLYSYTYLVFDGQSEESKRCARCELIYDHLLTRARTELEDTTVDERLNCGHTYEEVHGQPPPPEIAELAFMTPAEAQARLAQKAGHS
jgi:rubredoxin